MTDFWPDNAFWMSFLKNYTITNTRELYLCRSFQVYFFGETCTTFESCASSADKKVVILSPYVYRNLSVLHQQQWNCHQLYIYLHKSQRFSNIWCIVYKKCRIQKWKTQDSFTIILCCQFPCEMRFDRRCPFTRLCSTLRFHSSNFNLLCDSKGPKSFWF